MCARQHGARFAARHAEHAAGPELRFTKSAVAAARELLVSRVAGDHQLELAHVAARSVTPALISNQRIEPNLGEHLVGFPAMDDAIAMATAKGRAASMFWVE